MANEATLTIDTSCFKENLDIINEYTTEKEKKEILKLIDHPDKLVKDGDDVFKYYLYVPLEMHELAEKYLKDRSEK